MGLAGGGFDLRYWKLGSWHFRAIQPISGWIVAPRSWLVLVDCSRFASIDNCITLIFVHGHMVMVCVCVYVAIRSSSGVAAGFGGFWKVVGFYY